MAVYPAGNPGIYPLDANTPVGQFRLVYGDITSEPYDPPNGTYQNYSELSDAEISAFLSQGNNSTSRAIATYYLSLAGQAAKESASVQDYDLRIDLTKRAADLRAMAEMWFGRADDDDASDALDAFEILPTGVSTHYWPPEASPWAWR